MTVPTILKVEVKEVVEAIVVNIDLSNFKFNSEDSPSTLEELVSEELSNAVKGKGSDIFYNHFLLGKSMTPTTSRICILKVAVAVLSRCNKGLEEGTMQQRLADVYEGLLDDLGLGRQDS